MEQKINKYEHRSGTTTNNNTNSVRVFAFSPPSPSPLHFLFNNLPLLSISLLYSLQRAAITFLFLLKTTKIWQKNWTNEKTNKALKTFDSFHPILMFLGRVLLWKCPGRAFYLFSCTRMSIPLCYGFFVSPKHILDIKHCWYVERYFYRLILSNAPKWPCQPQILYKYHIFHEQKPKRNCEFVNWLTTM